MDTSGDIQVAFRSKDQPQLRASKETRDLSRNTRN